MYGMMGIYLWAYDNGDIMAVTSEEIRVDGFVVKSFKGNVCYRFVKFLEDRYRPL